MKENAVNWDAVPDVITKDQLYRICHISKSTALYLLQSGKIPCEYTGRKTRCYKIKKADVIAYLVQSGAHQVFPEKQCQPYSEGLFGGVLLFHLLSHHHPQIAVACSGAETLPGLEKSETDGRRRKEKSLAYKDNLFRQRY